MAPSLIIGDEHGASRSGPLASFAFDAARVELHQPDTPANFPKDSLSRCGTRPFHGERVRERLPMRARIAGAQAEPEVVEYR